jgi:hypothetical protein
MSNTSNTSEETQQEEQRPEFDFDYITSALGLIPIHNNTSAINPTAITDISYEADEDVWIFTLQGGETYGLDDEEMAEFEASIRARQEAARLAQVEAIKNNIRSQAEAMADMRGNVTSAQGIITGNVGKAFKRQ